MPLPHRRIVGLEQHQAQYYAHWGGIRRREAAELGIVMDDLADWQVVSPDNQPIRWGWQLSNSAQPRVGASRCMVAFVRLSRLPEQPGLVYRELMIIESPEQPYQVPSGSPVLTLREGEWNPALGKHVEQKSELILDTPLADVGTRPKDWQLIIACFAGYYFKFAEHLYTKPPTYGPVVRG